jgi:hypothetical protein
MNFKRICEGLPIEPLLKQLDAHPDWWNEIVIRQIFLGSAHHMTQSIHLRGPVSFCYEDAFLSTETHDYPLLAPLMPALMPVIGSLLSAIRYSELGRVLIVRLPPGGALDPHIDQGAYAEHFTRYHVALRTNEDCALVVDDEPQHMAAGEAWWFEHRKTHSAFNRGSVERIHLILDAVPT